MSLDLVQIRWQQLRAIESHQITESENILLKKKIEYLKNQSTKFETKTIIEDQSYLNQEKSSINNASIFKIANSNRAIILNLKTEITKLRFKVNEDISILVSQKELLRQAFYNLNVLFRTKVAEYDSLIYEKESLQNKLEEANNNQEDIHLSLKEKLFKAKNKLDQVTTALQESTYQNSKLSEEIDNYKKQLVESTLLNQELENKNQHLVFEAHHFQQLMEQVNSENSKAIIELNQNQLNMQLHYEKIIEDISTENENLRKICTEQEDRISKLTNSLIGNKSHFARYVEVKTENLTLQSKLDVLRLKAGNINNSLPTVKRSTTTTAVPNNKNSTYYNIIDSSASNESNMLPAYQRRAKALLIAATQLQQHQQPTSLDNNTTQPSSSSSSALGVQVHKAKPPQAVLPITTAMYI